MAGTPYKAPYKSQAITRQEIGKIIQARRQRLGMTDKEFHKHAGFTSEQNWEKAIPKKIKIETLIKVDNALGFDGELIGLTWALFERELAEKFQIH
jgi:hypothetical protein